MSHILLTGATGLLGGYLLRDLMLQGRDVAVVVRNRRREEARQRVERILWPWEQQWGQTLCRPVVLVGDIGQPGLGLDQHALSWVAKHCDTVLHSAASLAFEEEKGEPWHSNVEGVRNVLGLCRQAGIGSLHHVSTAYVCGMRTGRVYEHEGDVGQQYANVYEQSKAQAEQLVRDADGLKEYTIYRPSIIVGDSRTGYTTTFHGFYTPLRLAQAMCQQVFQKEMPSETYLDALNMTGEERKNFVPVDWVSDAILSIADRQQRSHQTYSLTSDHPVRADELRAAFEQVVREFWGKQSLSPRGTSLSAGSAAPKRTTGQWDKSRLEQEFARGFSVYRSYWKGDPEFDSRNTQELIPDKPCPRIDGALLVRLSRFALERDFGFPPPVIPTPDFCVADWLGGIVGSEPVNPVAEGAFTLISTGPGGGKWVIGESPDGKLTVCSGGCPSDGVLRLRTSTLHQIVKRQMDVTKARHGGLVVATLTDAQWQLFCRLVGASGGQARVVFQPTLAGV